MGESINKKGGWYRIDNLVADRYLAHIGSNAMAVYNLLSRFSDRKGESWPSVSTLARLSGLHPDTVRKSLKILRNHGLIEIKRRKSGGLNRTNIYTLIPVSGTRTHRVPDTGEYDENGDGTRSNREKVPEQTEHEQDPEEQDPEEQDPEEQDPLIQKMNKEEPRNGTSKNAAAGHHKRGTNVANGSKGRASTTREQETAERLRQMEEIFGRAE